MTSSALGSSAHNITARATRGGPGLKLVMLAGLIGGAAEVVWIALYAWLTPIEGALVARAVTTTLFPALAGASAAAIAGIAIHFALSVGLAALFYALVWRALADVSHGLNAAMLASTASLMVVWAVNFLIVLPWLNPDFVQLLPYSVTFISKFLFGIAMGWTLYRFS